MRAEDIHPVGVIGAGHSGTTIVYRMLALHPDATWFSQFSYRAVVGPPPVRAAARWLDRLLRHVGSHDWGKVRRRSGWRRLIATPIEGHDLWEFALRGDEPTSAARIRAVFAAVRHLAGKTTVIVKPPGKYRSRCAPVISAVFPASRYLHVTRDGRAVALSVYGKYVRRTPEERSALLRRGADHWVSALRQIQRYERLLPLAVIRYESLCGDVWGEIRRALEFVELDPGRFPFAQLPRALTSTNEARISRAAPEDLAVLDGLLADDLRRYGYAPR